MVKMTTIDNIYGTAQIIEGEDPFADVKVAKATAKPGYTFARWTGDVGDADPASNPITIHFSSIKTYKRIIATFVQDIQYTLTVRASQYGTASIEEFAFYPQHKIATAIPDFGYRFKEWIGDPVYVTDSNKHSNPIDISMLQSNRTTELEAVYEEDPQVTKAMKSDGSVLRVRVDGVIDASHIGRSNPALTIDSSIEEVQLGTTVTGIANDCFRNCTALTSIAYLTDYMASGSSISQAWLRYIGDYAFYNTGLASFEFRVDSNGIGTYAFSNTRFTALDFTGTLIEKIPDGCFRECQQLVSLKLPSTVHEIGEYAFDACTALTTIDLKAYSRSLPTIQSTTFLPINTVFGRVFYLKSTDESQIAYDTIGTWKNLYPEIDPQIHIDTLLQFKVSRRSTISFKAYLCQPTATVNFGDASSIELSYSKNGTDVSHKYQNAYELVDVIVNDALSSISVNDSHCIGIGQLGTSISYLPKKAFGNTVISALNIPSTIKNIAIGAALSCNNLDMDHVTVENGSKIDSNYIVISNGRLVNLFNNNSTTLLDGEHHNIVTLPAECFDNSGNLTSIKLPATLQNIEMPILPIGVGLPKLQSISIQSSNRFVVSSGALMSTDGKVYLTTKSTSSLPSSATQLLRRCFPGNSSTSISLPSSITYVASDAFMSCPNLEQLDVPGIQLDAMTEQFLTQNRAWIWGGPAYATVNDDSKIQVKSIQIACANGNAQAIALTQQYAYLLKPLQPNKVICLTVSNEYIGSSNPLYGMTNDSDRIASMLDGFSSSIIKLKNSDATKRAVTQQIQNIISTLGDDDLFIFHDSGHGGNNNGKQYMVLYDSNLYDYEFWELIKNARCRVMAIFCTCHSGTMFSARPPSQLLRVDSIDGIADGIDDEEEEDIGYGQKSWVSSAIEYFSGMEPYQPPQQLATSRDSLLRANAPVDFAPRLCVYGACADDEVSYMAFDIGHGLITSLVENFNRNNKLDSYYSLFYNSTTSHEKSRCIIYDYPTRYVLAPDQIHPQYYASDDFDDNARVFT